MRKFQLDVPSSSSAQRQPESPEDDNTPMQMDSEEENEEAMNNSDSSSCIICSEPWKSEGLHQACCLPCGHVLCFSCVNRWIQEKGIDAKCPLCNKLYNFHYVRKLFLLPAVVLDEDLRKRNRDREVENCYLMSRIEALFSEQDVLRERLAYLKQFQRTISNLQLDVPSQVTPMQIDVEKKNEEATNNSNSSRCTICTKRLKSEGHHQACSLPCGHVFGFSCIDKLIQLEGIDAKCLVCKQPYTSNDVRKLYGLPAVVVDEDLKKENEVLADQNWGLQCLVEELVNANSNLHEEVKSYEEVLWRMPYSGRDGQ